jgi:hypothetical protein
MTLGSSQSEFSIVQLTEVARKLRKNQKCLGQANVNLRGYKCYVVKRVKGIPIT